MSLIKTSDITTSDITTSDIKTNDIKTNSIKTNKCCNCGYEGHVYKECLEPITSYGIIAYKLIKNSFNEKDPYSINVKKMLEKIKINNFYKVENENKNIKFLMIQRKQTMAYVDLIRGKYNENDDDQIDILSKEMTVSEINNIKNKYFDELWDKLWINHNCISYKKEYEYAKNKFLKFNKKKLYNIKSKYLYEEWGFPKGRKQIYETTRECAEREFEEETGYKKQYLNNRNDNNIYIEEFIGTNNIKYKHVYYLLNMDESIYKPSVNKNNKIQYGEVKNIGWFTYEECIHLMRPYDIAKKEVLSKVYKKIINDELKE